MVDIADIEKAALRLDGVSIRTPLLQNFDLDQMADGRVLIKPESLQVTGSFKIRGAYNRLSQLTTAEAANGVVAWSSGNHAQGIAAAGAMLDIQTAIVMPNDAPKTKVDNTRRLGGLRSASNGQGAGSNRSTLARRAQVARLAEIMALHLRVPLVLTIVAEAARLFP